jgi:hypothetical protein
MDGVLENPLSFDINHSKQFFLPLDNQGGIYDLE